MKPDNKPAALTGRARATPGDYVPSYAGQSAASRCEELLQQLAALTQILYGAEGEAFRGCAEEVQDGVLWLVADLAIQARDLFTKPDA